MAKKKLVIVFNDIDKPFIRLVSYNNDVYEKHQFFYLDEHEIENDELVNLEKGAVTIGEFEPHVNEVYLIINSKHTFKNTLTFPKLSKRQSNIFYKRDMKPLLERTKDHYLTRVLHHSYPLGEIFYTYFVPSKIVHSFKKLCKLLNARFMGFDLYPLQIANYITPDPKTNTVYFIEDGSMGTFIYIIDNVVCSSISFTIAESAKMNAALYSFISKHEYELEKKEIRRMISYSGYVYFSDLQDAIEIKYEQKKVEPRFKFKGVLPK
jgi:hypothetical protein